MPRPFAALRVTGLGRSEWQVGAFRRHHTTMSAPPARLRGVPADWSTWGGRESQVEAPQQAPVVGSHLDEFHGEAHAGFGVPHDGGGAEGLVPNRDAHAQYRAGRYIALGAREEAEGTQRDKIGRQALARSQKSHGDNRRRLDPRGSSCSQSSTPARALRPKT